MTSSLDGKQIAFLVANEGIEQIELTEQQRPASPAIVVCVAETQVAECGPTVMHGRGFGRSNTFVIQPLSQLRADTC